MNTRLPARLEQAVDRVTEGRASDDRLERLKWTAATVGLGLGLILGGIGVILFTALVRFGPITGALIVFLFMLHVLGLI